MDIKIRKNKYGSLFAVDAETNRELFQFEYRRKCDGGPAWFFWLRGQYDPDKVFGKKKDFPMNFFVNACRAKCFLLLGRNLDDVVNIVQGKENIA